MTISNAKRDSANTPHRITFANVKDGDTFEFQTFNQLVQKLADVPVGVVGSYELPPVEQPKTE